MLDTRMSSSDIHDFTPEFTAGERKQAFHIVRLRVNKYKSQEIDDTIKRIQAHKGVMGIIIINSDGIPIKSTMDNATSVHYASHIHSLATKARAVVKEIDSTNDLRFLRIRSKKHEILVAPEPEYCMIVIQKDAN